MMLAYLDSVWLGPLVGQDQLPGEKAAGRPDKSDVEENWTTVFHHDWHVQVGG